MKSLCLFLCLTLGALAQQVTQPGGAVSNPSTNGIGFWNGASLTTTPTGGAGTLCLTSVSGGTPVFGSCAGSAATAWSAVTAGNNATALVMATGGTLSFSGTGTINANLLNGTALSGLATGILKNTTSTGVPSIAVAADFPTLNQATTGNAATATALAAAPSLCSAGNYPLGINASGTAQSCTAAPSASAFFLVSKATNAPTNAINLGAGSAGIHRQSVAAGVATVSESELSGDATTSASNAVTVVGINGTLLSGLATGILKNTTSTGVPSIAVAADFPTLNQATTGNAATATALAATPSLCAAGSFPLGVAASGNAASCFVLFTGTFVSGNYLSFTGTTGEYQNSGIALGNATNVNGAVVPISATVLASNGSKQIIAASYQGNGALVQLSTGTTTSGDCVQFDANGNTTDAGSACGTGGGGANPLGYYLVSQTSNAPANAINLGAGSAGIHRQSVAAGVATVTESELSGDATTSASNAVTVVGINGTAFSGASGDVVAFGSGNTPADAGVVAANLTTNSTSGTTNFLPKWTAGHVLGNSTFSDNGTQTIAGEQQDMVTYPIVQDVVNDTTNGTTANLLSKLVSTGAIAATTGDTAIPVYITASGAGKSGSAQLAFGGHASCKMDASTSNTEGFFVIASTTNGGDCHATSVSPSGVFVVGTLISNSTTSGSSATVLVNPYLATTTSGAPAFSAITSGSNTTATMTCGTGCTVTTAGSGIVNADQVNGATVPASATVAATNSSNQVIAAALATGSMWAGNGSSLPAAFAGPTTPNSVAQILTSTPSGAAATTPVWALPGISVDAQSSATPSVGATDRVSLFQTTNNTTSTAVTVPAVGSTGFGSNYAFVTCNTGSVAATHTPTTSTVNGNATLTLVGAASNANPECAFFWSDSSNYWAAEILPTDTNGRLQAAGMPAFTGDATNTAGALALTVAKINGTAFSGTNGNVVSFGASNTPADSGIVAGNVTTNSSSGSSNFMPKWTSAHVLGNSTLSDNGSQTVAGEQHDMAAYPIVQDALNDTTTGTTVATVAKLVSTGAIIAGTSDTTVPVYITASGAGKFGSAQLAFGGQTACKMDASTSNTEGFFVVASTTTGGDCHAQSATPSGVFVVGTMVSNSTTSGSNATVLANPYFANTAGSGAPSFSAVTSGSNTTATMTCGTGCSVTTSGTGTNNANQLNSGTVPASATVAATNGSNQIIAAALSTGTVWNGSSNLPSATSTPTLGASGTLGSVTMGNATSGTVTLAPVTGALGSVTSSLPATTTMLAGLSVIESWAATQTFPGGDLFLGGVNAQTGTSYTVLTTDANKLTTYSNALAIAVTLPHATTAGFGAGAFFHQKDIGVGTVTITPTTSQINGAATLVLTTNQDATIFSDGTNYWATVDSGTGNTVTGGTCTSQVATAIAAITGAPTCTTITSSYVDTSIAKTGTDINTSNQVTVTHLAAGLPRNQGGLNSTSAGTGILRDGTTPAAAELSGDVTTSGSNAATVVQIEGGVIPASAHVVGTNSSKQDVASTAGDLAAINWVAGGGTAQAQTATYSPAVASLVDGLTLCWKPTAANTATAPTFSPSSLTAHTLVKVPNATALVANDLITTQQACAIYDSTGTQWELQNPATASSTLTNPLINTDASLSASTGSGSYLPGTSLTAGNIYYVGGSGLAKAKADAASTVPGVCIADNTGTNCLYSGVFRFSGTQGWTEGNIIYVSDSSAGSLVTTAPSTSGHFVQRVGIALANDTILIMPSLDVAGL